MPTPIRGLYALTPDTADTDWLLGRLEQAILGGASLVQYRNKSAPWLRRRQQAEAVRALCAAYGVPLIVNDSVALAAQIGADGVHLGRDDGEPSTARAQLGAEAIVGVSCYGDLERAKRLRDQGASYLAFGRFYPSATKPDAPGISPSLLEQARTAFDTPLVAIGGIDARNAGRLVAAGADALAVLGALYDTDATARVAREIAALFRAPPSSDLDKRRDVYQKPGSV